MPSNAMKNAPRGTAKKAAPAAAAKDPVKTETVAPKKGEVEKAADPAANTLETPSDYPAFAHTVLKNIAAKIGVTYEELVAGEVDFGGIGRPVTAITDEVQAEPKTLPSDLAQMQNVLGDIRHEITGSLLPALERQFNLHLKANAELFEEVAMLRAQKDALLEVVVDYAEYLSALKTNMTGEVPKFDLTQLTEHMTASGVITTTILHDSTKFYAHRGVAPEGFVLDEESVMKNLVDPNGPNRQMETYAGNRVRATVENGAVTRRSNEPDELIGKRVEFRASNGDMMIGEVMGPSIDLAFNVVLEGFYVILDSLGHCNDEIAIGDITVIVEGENAPNDDDIPNCLKRNHYSDNPAEEERPKSLRDRLGFPKNGDE